MEKKKLQVFISSTYLDLIDERQAAVEAILKFGHIPAGMELFKAGNNSQMKTIMKWIDQSDVYMLILGGRYGSIEERSGRSYTHLEYEYAIRKNIPVFALILSDDFLQRKSSENENIYERDNPALYKEFKKYVQTKLIKEIDDIKDIQLGVYESLKELEEEHEFSGWVPGSLLDSRLEIFVTDDNCSLKDMKEHKGLIEERLNLLEEQLLNIDVRIVSEALSEKTSVRYVFRNAYVTEKEKNSDGSKSEYKCYITLIDVFLDISSYLQNSIKPIWKMKQKMSSTILARIDNVGWQKSYKCKVLNYDLNEIIFVLTNLGLIKIYPYKGVPIGMCVLSELGKAVTKGLYKK